MKAITSRRIVWLAVGFLMGAVLGVCIGMITPPLLLKGDVNDVAVITRLVDAHVSLPDNESPALITVTDPSKVSTAFLRQAQKGDKVLVYQNNKKAIIYRPSNDRIIAISTVSIDSPKPTEE